MKKIVDPIRILFIIFISFMTMMLILTLSSCSFKQFECPAYGTNKYGTKHGNEAQRVYARKN